MKLGNVGGYDESCTRLTHSATRSWADNYLIVLIPIKRGLMLFIHTERPSEILVLGKNGYSPMEGKGSGCKETLLHLMPSL